MRTRRRRLRAVPGGVAQPSRHLDFCRAPDELDDAITLVPEAVIEVISKGYEAKDLEIGPSFYLSQGVKDIVVFDPITLMVLHVAQTKTSRTVSPQSIELACGCSTTV